MKRLILITTIIATLTGCAATPPTPAFQLTDAQLCAELGHASAYGNSNRVAEVIAEGKNRDNSGRFTLDESTCTTLAQTGANAALQETAEAANRQRAAQALMAYGQQMQQQAAYENQMQQAQMNQQMQQMNQNMQMQQQTQALNSIASSIRGY